MAILIGKPYYQLPDGSQWMPQTNGTFEENRPNISSEDLGLWSPRTKSAEELSSLGATVGGITQDSSSSSFFGGLVDAIIATVHDLGPIAIAAYGGNLLAGGGLTTMAGASAAPLVGQATGAIAPGIAGVSEIGATTLGGAAGLTGTELTAAGTAAAAIPAIGNAPIGTMAEQIAGIQTASGLTPAQIASISQATGLPAEAITAIQAASAAGADSGTIAKWVASTFGISEAAAGTLLSTLTKAIPSLIAGGMAASAVKNINPNITAGPNTLTVGPGGTNITLDPSIAATRTAGLGVNTALMGDVTGALAAVQPAYDTYKTSNQALQDQNTAALAGYKSAVAPISDTYSGLQTGLSGLQGTEMANLGTFQSAVGDATKAYGQIGGLSTANLGAYKTALGGLDTTFGNLAGQGNQNLSTFQNALAPIGTELTDLYGRAGANEGGYVSSVTKPINEQVAIQKGKTALDYGMRGLSGSSLEEGAQAYQARLGGQAISDATAKALEQSLGLQAGIAGQQQGLAQAGFTAGQQTIAENASIAQQQAALAAAGYAADQANIIIQKGLTTDALNAAQSGFTAGQQAVTTNAGLMSQQAQVAQLQASMAQQGYSNDQIAIATQNLLSSGQLSASRTQLSDAEQAATLKAGFETNKQNIASGISGAGLATLGLGGASTQTAAQNAATLGNIYGSTALGLSNALGGSGYSATPTSAKPNANAFWNGYSWV